MKKRVKEKIPSVIEHGLILGFISIVLIAAMVATGGTVNTLLGHCQVPSNKRYSPLHISGNHLVTTTDKATAVNIKTGKIAWRKNDKSWLEGSTIDDSTVYLTMQNQFKAIDIKTGKTKYWKQIPCWATDKYRYIGPLITCRGPYLIASKLRSIFCYDKESTNLLRSWSSPFQNDWGEQTRLSFETTANHIYVNTKTSLVCLDLATGVQNWSRKHHKSLGIATTDPPTIVTFRRKHKGIAGLSAKGKIKWLHSLPLEDKAHNFVTRCAQADQNILIIWASNTEAYLDSINAQSGTHNWRYGPFRGDAIWPWGYPLSYTDLEHLYTSRPHANKTHAYFYSSDATIHQVNLATGAGCSIASFHAIATSSYNSWLAGLVPTKLVDIGAPITDLALKDDILYLCTIGARYHAFDTKKRCLLWSHR